ncbi:hypothetical protein IscW_ISCW006561 [Ixodes scapularis]|uniref:Uncharacterized protein n=1 Tax=Ixodes scapularis TaxID=6945 RepID=B7PPR3_IXOSC|nr:hypothetical protein IscW_ISCW006561 [Ixodes scapularis]|eukprot:XP_002435755.1 hypothetical protein IscW_ISCW006561 [Ixodes scapularis]
MPQPVSVSHARGIGFPWIGAGCGSGCGYDFSSSVFAESETCDGQPGITPTSKCRGAMCHNPCMSYQRLPPQNPKNPTCTQGTGQPEPQTQ